jgi:hypothetical protein
MICNNCLFSAVLHCFSTAHACSFDWNLNPQTGVPVELINVFSPNYDNASLPDTQNSEPLHLCSFATRLTTPAALHCCQTLCRGFDWSLNPQTGVPVELINVFSPNHDNASLPGTQTEDICAAVLRQHLPDNTCCSALL